MLQFTSEDAVLGVPRVIYSKKSRHQEIVVEESGCCRTLFSGTGRARKQSCVDLSNSRTHMLNYSSLTFSSLLFVPDPARVMVVGLGGGVVPREFVRCCPGVHVDVVEIDPEIVAVAKRFFLFEEGPRLKVRIGDARQVLRNMVEKLETSYDIIVLDAFTHEYVPDHLMTVEFMQDVRAILSDVGVVVANMFNTHPMYSRQVRTCVEVFGRVLHEVRGKRAPSTSIIFAAGAAARPLNDDAKHQAISLALRLKLSFVPEVPRLLVLDEGLAGAGVLSDKEIRCYA